MVKQYVGARYVPKFAIPLEWTPDTSYEALTIVTFNNASYTSKIQVPPTVGNPANNPKYWALTGNYNAQVEQYRQETETVSNNLTTEITNRKNADTTLQGQITTVNNNLTTEITNRKNADTALRGQITTVNNNLTTEITNRENADTTLQGNINSEVATRASADSNLQSQINQIVAPSGEAPSAAEVQNARIGANGVTYDTLGTAIRSQVDNLKSDLDRVLNKHVIIPANSTDYIKFYIPKNTDFTIKTADGNNFKITSELMLRREDKTKIDSWSMYKNSNERTVNSGSEDIYYININSNLPIDQEIIVSYADEKTIETRVENIETRVENIEDKIPSFYVNYLDNRISTIKEKDLLIGNNGDSFIFITDLHNENNYYSPKLAREICKKTSVNRIVYGGDYINEPSSKELAVSLLTTRRNKCIVKDDVIFTRGNHDTNPYGQGTLTVGEFYSIFDKHIEKHINTNKNTYFYNDNESQKIRYIFVDSGVDGSISDVQKNWIKTNTENLNSDWTVIVFTHYGIDTYTKGDRTNIKVYPSLTSVKEALANVSCKIACIICGHAHIDLSDTSGKYPIICTTCDAHGVQASSTSSDNRDVNTINEQAFDVFHIDMTNKKVYVTRIGGGENNVIESGNYSLNDREFSYS